MKWLTKDVELSLCDYLKTSKIFIHLNESSLANNDALLLACVLFIKEEKRNCQKLLFAKK